MIVIPEPEVVPNPLIGGTTTYSGKVFAGYNAKVSGDGTATDSATAVLNVNYATGELIVEPDEDALAAINSDVNGGGNLDDLARFSGTHQEILKIPKFRVRPDKVVVIGL